MLEFFRTRNELKALSPQELNLRFVDHLQSIPVNTYPLHVDVDSRRVKKIFEKSNNMGWKLEDLDPAMQRDWYVAYLYSLRIGSREGEKYISSVSEFLRLAKISPTCKKMIMSEAKRMYASGQDVGEDLNGDYVDWIDFLNMLRGGENPAGAFAANSSVQVERAILRREARATGMMASRYWESGIPYDGIKATLKIEAWKEDFKKYHKQNP